MAIIQTEGAPDPSHKTFIEHRLEARGCMMFSPGNRVYPKRTERHIAPDGSREDYDCIEIGAEPACYWVASRNLAK